MLEKITEEQLLASGVSSAPDRLTGKASENKKIFDRLVFELVAPGMNACIDELNAIRGMLEQGLAAGVSTFNGRFGAVKPESGDYTAEMVGAADKSLEDYNQHWWKLTETVKYIYTETRTVSGYINVSPLAAEPSRTLNVADAVSVDPATGTVSLVSPGTETVAIQYDGEFFNIVVGSGRDVKEALLGKYISGLYGSDGVFCVKDETNFFTSEEYYFNEDTGEEGMYQYIVANKLEQIGSEQTPLPQEVTLVHSEDRNAYPDSGSDAEYFYEYLGVPFDNLPVAGKVEAGSYVGTGTAGTNNRNKLTFSFAPKLVIISRFSDNYMYFFLRGSNLYTISALSGQTLPTFAYLRSYWSGNTLEWYYDYSTQVAQPQANSEGATYYYIAVG